MSNKIIFGFLIVLLFANFTFAFETNIIIKPFFSKGEDINFSYTFISETTTEKIIYEPGVYCHNTPIPFRVTKETILQKGVLNKNTYRFLKVNDSIEPQDCTAYVQILSPVEQKVEKTFRIKTDPSFEFSLFLCKDESGSEKSTIFVQEESVFLNYNSEVTAPIIKITLTSPDDSQQEISSPSSITASQIGTYSLEAIASKEGYKTITKSIEFVVLEHEPNIPFAGECNANEVCDSGENSQNCPQDCVKGTNSSEEGIDLTLIAISVLAVAIIGFLLFKKFK